MREYKKKFMQSANIRVQICVYQRELLPQEIVSRRSSLIFPQIHAGMEQFKNKIPQCSIDGTI